MIHEYLSIIIINSMISFFTSYYYIHIYTVLFNFFFVSKNVNVNVTMSCHYLRIITHKKPSKSDLRT